jgi:hypothetical protein
MAEERQGEKWLMISFRAFVVCFWHATPQCKVKSDVCQERTTL